MTSLNAVNLIGSVPDARLSANVALLNASQTFSGQNTFSGAMSLGSTLRMNRNTIYFREGSDPYHGLSWSGSSPFAGISPDGPVLYGGTGGGLGFTGGTTNLALAWNNTGGGNAFTDPAGLNGIDPRNGAEGVKELQRCIAASKGFVGLAASEEEAQQHGVMVCPESGFRYKEVSPGVVKCLDLDEEAPLPANLASGTKAYDEFKSK